MSDRAANITRLLAEAYEGRESALDEVMRLVYRDLHRIAEKQLRRRGHRLSLETTELVSETFLKLVKQRKRYDSRGHFFAIATGVMIRVLLDHHRKKGRAKRGGQLVRVALSGAEKDLARDPEVRIPDFVEALERLEALAPRTAEVVKLRLLWGLTVPESAEALGTSTSTVEREWRFARRWLGSQLREKSENTESRPRERA
jgi:RNA polymerase sigma factor (TIGR02999 family)